MDLTTAINQLQNEYRRLINSLSVVDDNDPIPPSKLKELLSYLNIFINDLKNSLSTMTAETNDINKNSSELKKNYEKNISLLKKNLNQSLSVITNERKKASSILEAELKKEKSQTNAKIRQFLLDTEYFLTTSEQNKLLLTTDFEEAKHRYDYQRGEAKESYHNIVTKYNNSLALIKNNLSEEYKVNSTEYKKDYDEIIVKLNKLIEAKTKELNTLNTLLTNERNLMKERNHKESTLLNENIKKISTEKNIQIDKARNQYSKALAEANIERENKRQTYQANSQSLLKEFVTKINEIDDIILKTKKELETKTDEIKRNYFYLVQDITTEFHNSIKVIYEKANNNNLDHYYLRLIKTKTKEYNLKINELKKETEEQLVQITKYYTRIIEENKYAKGYLEIDKNHAIKRLTDQEQYDNKYYQEKSNIYENDSSYIIKNANFKFSQKANVLRNQSQKRYKLLERNFSGIEANYYKKIETIQNKINFYNLEIRLTKELKEIIGDYQEKNYLNNLHLEEVTNLLEIEKNKLLLEYNEKKYQFNLKSITQSLNYGFQRISIQNQKQQSMTDLNSSLEKLLLEEKQINTTLDIEKKILEEKYDKLNTQLKYNEDLRNTKLEYNYSLYDIDVEIVNKINEFYEEFFSKIQKAHEKAVQLLFTDINYSLENILYLEAIYNSFLSCFIKCYNNALDSYVEIIHSIIDKRLKFIEEFKYKSTYESLNTNFSKQQTIIKEKISILLDQNDSYKKTIENFNQKIYTLINDNEMLRSSNTGKKKKLDSKSLNIILSNQLKIKEYKDKIDNFRKMITLNNQDLYQQNNKLQTNKLTFDKEIIKVKQMQANDSKNYSLYRSNVSNMINDFKLYLAKTIKKANLSKSKDKNILSRINKSQNSFYNLLNKTNNKLKSMLLIFKENLSIEIKQSKSLLEHELDNYIKAYNRQKEKAFATFHKESIDKINNIELKVVQHKDLIINTNKNFEEKLAKANIDYQNDGINLKKLSEVTTIKFFNDYYALEDNYTSIVNYHRKQKKLIQEKFDRLKNQSVKWSVNEKESLNSKLKLLVKTKNEEIEYLPIAYKYNTNLLNKETKRRNNEISINMKKSKNDFNVERKRIEKELQILKASYHQTKLQNDYNQEIELIIEKKKDRNQLTQALKSIRISLDSK